MCTGAAAATEAGARTVGQDEGGVALSWSCCASLTSLALTLRSRLPVSPRMAAAPLVVAASAFASELAYRTVTASTWKLQFGAASSRTRATCCGWRPTRPMECTSSGTMGWRA